MPHLDIDSNAIWLSSRQMLELAGSILQCSSGHAVLEATTATYLGI